MTSELAARAFLYYTGDMLPCETFQDYAGPTRCAACSGVVQHP